MMVMNSNGDLAVLCILVCVWGHDRNGVVPSVELDPLQRVDLGLMLRIKSKTHSKISWRSELL